MFKKKKNWARCKLSNWRSHVLTPVLLNHICLCKESSVIGKVQNFPLSLPEIRECGVVLLGHFSLWQEFSIFTKFKTIQ